MAREGLFGMLGDFGGLIRLFLDPFLKKKVAETTEALTQQAPGIVPGYDDEAIQIGLDAALGKLYSRLYVLAIAAVRNSLQDFQKKQWRMALTKLILTERHERVETSRKTTRQEASPRGPAREETLSEWARVPLDYEYTVKDPRIMHLKMIAEMAGVPHTEAGIAAAKAYLLSSGYVTEKSVSQKLAEETAAAWEKGASGTYRLALSLQLGDVYDDIVGCEHMTDEQRAQSLARAADHKAAEKAAQLAALKAQPLIPWQLKVFLAVGAAMLTIVIIGCTILWYIKNWGV